MFIILVYKIFSRLFVILEIEMCCLYEMCKIEMIEKWIKIMR